MHSGEPSPELLAEKKAVPASGKAARDTPDAPAEEAAPAVPHFAAAAGLAAKEASTAAA